MATITDVRKIQRVPLSHVDDVEAQLRGEVLTKANNLFGYKADSFGAAGPLAKLLTELGITPLKTEQVREYMASKEKEVEKSYNLRVVMGWFGLVVGCWTALLGHWGANASIWFVGPATLVTLIGSISIPTMASEDVFGKVRYKRYWHKYGLSDAQRSQVTKYSRYIPVHVLDTAVRIAEKNKNADFFINELTITSERIAKPQPDPFMEVVLGAEHYFLEVWDEREFEAKM
jgi:hypothetical protein